MQDSSIPWCQFAFDAERPPCSTESATRRKAKLERSQWRCSPLSPNLHPLKAQALKADRFSHAETALVLSLPKSTVAHH